MIRNGVRLMAMAGLSVAALSAALAQEQPAPTEPAPATEAPASAPAPDASAPAATTEPSLPDVEVIQDAQPKPKPQQAAKPKPSPAPAPAVVVDEPEPVAAPEVVDDVSAPSNPNPVYGATGSAGAAARANQSATTPANPSQLLPSNLDGFSSAASNVSPEVLAANKPSTVNEALTRVPGVIVINDDAAAHHGGVALRGSPARRSRKVLVMEDGHPVNLALWLDPSVHYWGPVDRFESIEVLRGSVITHGPNNNFGVVNARNLSPFGPNETVISSAIGFTKTRRGSYAEAEEFDAEDVEDGAPVPFGEATSKGDETDLSGRWHIHTRQQVENVGMVFSYTGEDLQGAWDAERLKANDFYGALGFRGSSQDVVVSLSYARQRDTYDEQNFLGEYEFEVDAATQEEAEEAAEAFAEEFLVGLAERQFRDLKHCKTCFAPASGLNNYNGDIWRGQVVHNAYLDDDTTITTRVYAGHHTRDRYQLISYDSDPREGDDSGPVIGGTDFEEGVENSQVLFGENTMFGRLRTFRHIGGEVRAEWANRQIFGLKQDLQAGIRYEYQDMTNRNFLGRDDEALSDGDETGLTIFDRELDANAASAFLQTNVSLTSDFNVVPGVRFEWYQASRQNRVVAREESEAGGADDDDCTDNGLPVGCLEIDGIVFDPSTRNEAFDNFHTLPGVAFAYTGLKHTTVFGGYHRGMSTGILRNEDFPVEDEIGDNFNLGFRSNAIRGLDLEVVGFYQLLHDYQFGASFNAAIDRSFGRADEVEISGVELYSRLNSQPYTGGPMNVYGEVNYTYSRGVFKDLVTPDGEDLSGNRIPEVPLHVAALTLGVQQTTGWRWDTSVTWTYRGAFFTDEGNTAFGAGGEVECEGDPGDFECELEEAGEDGEVPSVWLLSARANLDIGNTGASVFVAGENLLDELYISDREDGMKPGLGRTLWTGFKYKF
ncbi:MAG: TonB-dependent receptor [Hyphomicrobium sp.]|nr:TonB-dependent receptor [Hyphomicrobium sp.]